MIISSTALIIFQPIRDLYLIVVNVRKLSNLLSTVYFISAVFQMLRQVAPYLDLPDSALRLAYFKVSTDTAGIVCSCER